MHHFRQYKQASGQGCLVRCLYFLAKIPCSVELERRVLINGLFLERDSYTLAVALAFLQENPNFGLPAAKITMFVDNLFYARQLQARQTSSSQQLSIRHQAITMQFLQRAHLPMALYIDRHDFGSYSHWPHFVVILGRSGSDYLIMDPWTGGRKRRTGKDLDASLETLRNTLKICPIAFKITKP